MTLIELNGRQDDPDVRAVLCQAHGSTAALEAACDEYRSGNWRFIGWQENDQLVACIGAEQHPDATIGISSLVVLPERRSAGLGRRLVQALAEQMDAKRVVAETDDDAVGFYRRCGFGVEDVAPKFGRPRYWCVLRVAE